MAGEEEKQRALVVHTGGLGDLILLSEFVASFKKAHPESTLTLLCRDEFTAIVDCYPIAPDEVIGVPFQPYSWAEPSEELLVLIQPLLSQLAGRRVSLLVDAALRPN